jgi:hypothetical protein
MGARIFPTKLPVERIITPIESHRQGHKWALPRHGLCTKGRANTAMALIRTLFWTAIFLGATFFFTVIFEHGPSNLSENAKKEVEALQAMVGKKIEKPKDQSDKLTPPLH